MQFILQIELAKYLYESLLSVPNIHVYGPAPSENVDRAALCSFNIENIHPTDIATFLDQQVGEQAKPYNCGRFLVFMFY